MKPHDLIERLGDDYDDEEYRYRVQYLPGVTDRYGHEGGVTTATLRAARATARAVIRAWRAGGGVIVPKRR